MKGIKVSLFFFLILVILMAGCKKSEEVTVEPTPSPAEATTTFTVRMTDVAFEPAFLTIKTGDTVNFLNSGTILRWPASEVHPIHQLCPGFDALRPIEPGSSYTYTFSVAKECPMHDHLDPSLKGKVTVQ